MLIERPWWQAQQWLDGVTAQHNSESCSAAAAAQMAGVVQATARVRHQWHDCAILTVDADQGGPHACSSTHSVLRKDGRALLPAVPAAAKLAAAPGEGEAANGWGAAWGEEGAAGGTESSSACCSWVS